MCIKGCVLYKMVLTALMVCVQGRTKSFKYIIYAMVGNVFSVESFLKYIYILSNFNELCEGPPKIMIHNHFDLV